MKRICLILAVLLLVVFSTKAQTALQLNNTLAAITDSLFAKGQSWGIKFNEAYKNGNYLVLKPLSANMLSFINRETAHIQNMKDIKNSKPLRMAMLELLAFEKQMVVEGFIPFESFTAATPADKVQTALASLTEKSKPENEKLKTVSDAQDAYAAENGFTIAPAKP